MTKVTIDDNGTIRIPDLTASVEFCDKSGKTVGHFYPVQEIEASFYDSVQSPYSDEELERRSKEEGGSSLAEIWQRLCVK